MYVAPRPTIEDDPLFPVRISACCGAMFAAVEVFNTDMPSLTMALPLAFALGLRGAFNTRKLIGMGIAGPLLAWIMGWIFAVTREVPMLMVLSAFTLILAGIHLARQKGNSLGFIFAMIAVLLSTMALQHRAMLDIMRDELILDCIAGALVVTVLYALIPPRTRAVHDDIPQEATENLFAGSVLRAAVVTGFCFWLYTVLPATDMIMALTALFPLVYPGRRPMFVEAKARLWGTFYGLVMIAPVLLIFTAVPHFVVMMAALALAGLWFGWKMFDGPLPVMAYQFGLTTLLATTMTALFSQAPFQAILARLCLTLAGAAGAVILVILVEETFPRLFKADRKALAQG